MISEIPFDLFCVSTWLNPFHQNVMFTLLLGLFAIMVIDSLRKSIKEKTVKAKNVVISLLLLALISVAGFLGFVDYGFWGVLLPVMVYLGKTRQQKLVFFTLGAAVLAVWYGGIQWFSLLTVPLLMRYNGQRGKAKLKNLFYIYYPAHLVAIYAIGLIA